MIILDFLFDYSIIAEEKDTNIWDIDAGLLHETYFVMPVRFYVNGKEMFERTTEQTILLGSPDQLGLVPEKHISTSVWLPLPILHVASTGFDKVKNVCKGKKEIYELPGMGCFLSYKLINNQIEILSTYNNYISYAQCQDVFNAFEMFANKVKIKLVEELPEFKRHPIWGAWLEDIQESK